MNLDVSVRLFRGYMRTTLLLGALLTGFGPLAHAQSAQRDIVLMLDNSGSMRQNDPDFLTRVAVRAFIEGLDDGYHVAIISFDQQVKMLQPLAALDDAHRGALLESLADINYNGLLTNSPAALERSIYELRNNGRADAEKSIVFMTDGIVDVAPEGNDEGDVEKARWMKSTMADEAVDSSVRVFGIAFTDNADFELIQTLAKRTGGEYYRAYTAADIDGVFTSIRDLLSDSTLAATPARSANRIPTQSVSGTSDVGENAETLYNTAIDEESKSAATAIDDPSLAATDTALDDTSPTASLPGFALPEVSLADAELPPVRLPEISPDIGGATIPAAALAPATPETTSDSAAEMSATKDAGATPTVERTTGGAKQTTSSVKDDVPLPAAMDDTKFYLALAVGAAAILLALASLVFVLIRRKPAAAALDDALMPKAFINDISESTEKQSYELGAKPIVVGRIKGADSEVADYIVIDETTIGRRHALIEYKEHSFWVTDQNSLNGTFVNNARLETGVRLKHGDRIRFHKHEFEFLVLDMFETDRTMMSDTVFSDLSASSDGDDSDATMVRPDDNGDFSLEEPAAEDTSITRT